MSSSRRWKRQETTTNSTLPEPRQGIHQAQVVNINNNLVTRLHNLSQICYCTV